MNPLFATSRDNSSPTEFKLRSRWMQLECGPCDYLTEGVRPMYGVVPVVKTSKHPRISNLVEPIRTGTNFSKF